MTNDNKLKILIGVLFVFIVILIAMLVYLISTGDHRKYSSPASQSVVSEVTDTQQPSTGSAVNVKETIDLKLYYYDADDYNNAKEIRTVKIDKGLYKNDITAAINELLSSAGLKINKAVQKGNLMTIDIPKDTAMKFNSGSAGGITYTNILAMTTLNLPEVKTMEVTVDGQSGIEADHFNFNGTFSKSEDGKKYTFTVSDKASKSLDF